MIITQTRTLLRSLAFPVLPRQAFHAHRAKALPSLLVVLPEDDLVLVGDHFVVKRELDHRISIQ